MQKWFIDNNIEWVKIQKGKPQQNAIIERFNRTFREDILDTHIFSNIDELQKIINLWNILAQKNGFDGIHFMRYLGPFDNKIQIDSIEGFVEFEPGYCMQKYYNEIKATVL